MCMAPMEFIWMKYPAIHMNSALILITVIRWEGDATGQMGTGTYTGKRLNIAHQDGKNMVITSEVSQ